MKRTVQKVDLVSVICNRNRIHTIEALLYVAVFIEMLYYIHSQ